MSKKRRGPVCTARESEVGLGDVAQGDRHPMETEAGKNARHNYLGAGRPRRLGVDVAGVADRNERQNERRRLDRRVGEALGPDVFLQAMYDRKLRETQEFEQRKDMARQKQLRETNGSAPASYRCPATGKRVPLFADETAKQTDRGEDRRCTSAAEAH